MQNNYGITWDHTANIQRPRNVDYNLTTLCNN